MAILYRGIALDPQTAKADRAAIRETGQLAAKAIWHNTMASPEKVRVNAEVLAASPAGIRAAIDAMPQAPLAYACAHFDDAARYALRERGVPVVVAFETTLEEVTIDGKDFLYTVFQLWARQGKGHRERVRATLASLYSPAILPWFDLACRESETMSRVGLCDLATHDLAAIEAHHANRTAIAGRYGTVFRSAFALPARVEPAAVLGVEDVAGPPAAPERVIALAEMLTP